MSIGFSKKVAAVPTHELERTAEIGAEAADRLQAPGSYFGPEQIQVVRILLATMSEKPEATSTSHGKHIIAFLKATDEAWKEKLGGRRV